MSQSISWCAGFPASQTAGGVGGGGEGGGGEGGGEVAGGEGGGGVGGGGEGEGGGGGALGGSEGLGWPLQSMRMADKDDGLEASGERKLL